MPEQLRIAFITGSLAQGGAEKQMVYMVKALCERGIDVRVYSLTQNEYYQEALEKNGVHPLWIGRLGNPALRITALQRELISFGPHIIQSAQFFTNLYSAIEGRLVNAISIGCIRSDIREEFRLNGIWGNALLRAPSTILANSYLAQQKTIEMGYRKEKIYWLPNVIDLSEFDRLQTVPIKDPIRQPGCFTVIAIARLMQVKRLDRFIQAIAAARREAPSVRGVIVGDGPEMQSLKQTAEREGLSSEELLFTGSRSDIPQLLSQADVLALTSDFEGFPNVLLEGMAGSLPVITTPAGDASQIVQEGVSGYIVPAGDIHELSGRILRLQKSEGLRRSMGQAGRWLVEQHYSYATLADQLLTIYREIAARQRKSSVLQMLINRETA